ncbi:hypothetical protein CYMTET_48952 [Cymbomonas tetramitiformis]|uniref:Uncharacterized protein n=1 Tax=Cymbomonas tetramitiformis TaxID=36881 RepID=A0AAE0BSA4_9CHLO|nr:hypothetical protein CYMTET_48952 [Cymbomonas tetramitiformis]
MTTSQQLLVLYAHSEKSKRSGLPYKRPPRLQRTFTRKVLAASVMSLLWLVMVTRPAPEVTATLHSLQASYENDGRDFAAMQDHRHGKRSEGSFFEGSGDSPDKEGEIEGVAATRPQDNETYLLSVADVTERPTSQLEERPWGGQVGRTWATNQNEVPSVPQKPSRAAVRRKWLEDTMGVLKSLQHTIRRSSQAELAEVPIDAPISSTTTGASDEAAVSQASFQNATRFTQELPKLAPPPSPPPVTEEDALMAWWNIRRSTPPSPPPPPPPPSPPPSPPSPPPPPPPPPEEEIICGKFACFRKHFVNQTEIRPRDLVEEQIQRLRNASRREDPTLLPPAIDWVKRIRGLDVGDPAKTLEAYEKQSAFISQTGTQQLVQDLLNTWDEINRANTTELPPPPSPPLLQGTRKSGSKRSRREASLREWHIEVETVPRGSGQPSFSGDGLEAGVGRSRAAPLASGPGHLDAEAAPAGRTRTAGTESVQEHVLGTKLGPAVEGAQPGEADARAEGDAAWRVGKGYLEEAGSPKPARDATQVRGRPGGEKGQRGREKVSTADKLENALGMELDLPADMLEAMSNVFREKKVVRGIPDAQAVLVRERTRDEGRGRVLPVHWLDHESGAKARAEQRHEEHAKEVRYQEEHRREERGEELRHESSTGARLQPEEHHHQQRHETPLPPLHGNRLAKARERQAVSTVSDILGTKYVEDPDGEGATLSAAEQQQLKIALGLGSVSRYGGPRDART